MAELSEALKGAENFSAALRALAGKDLAIDYNVPNPPVFKVLETRTDYFIGQWKDVEFIARYDMKYLLSLKK